MPVKRLAGKHLRHGNRRAAAATRDVERVDPGREVLEQPAGERKDVLAQALHDGLTALFRHHGMEARVGAVRHAAAVAERLDDMVLRSAQHRDPLRGDGDVVWARLARQADGVLGRQAVGPGVGVERDDASRHHRAEPLANVAFVQLRGLRDLRRRGRRQVRHAVEQPGPVPDAHHHRQAGVVDDLQRAFVEPIRDGFVECCDGHDLALSSQLSARLQAPGSRLLAPGSRLPALS